jgi:hypothetical protein
MHNVFQQTNEFMTYKRFFSHMRQLNNEQKVIVDDILYQKIINPIKPFHIFLTNGVGTRKLSLSCVLYKTCYDIILNKLQMIIH